MKWLMKKNYKRLYKRIEKLAATSKKYGVEYYFLSVRPVNEKQVEQKREASISPESFLNGVASAFIDLSVNTDAPISRLINVLLNKIDVIKMEKENADK